LTALLLVLSCLGCCAGGDRPQAGFAPNELSPTRLRSDDGTPPAPLRITDVPLAATSRPPVDPVDHPPGVASGPNRMPAPPGSTTTTTAVPAPVPAPAAAWPAADPLADVRRLYRQAAEAYAAIPAYSARLRQREQVAGKDRPEEVIQCKFRKQPWSVYFQWIGKEANGREVIYVQGRYENKIHSRLAAGDVPLMPAGMRFSIAPDSAMARGRSRHPITEAGVGPLIDRFGRLVEANRGNITYLGTQKRSEFQAFVEVVQQGIAPGEEAGLPRGGHRLVFFAADSHLPVLIITHDDQGHEVEYYCYEQIEHPARFSDDDFDPDRLWAKR
jgi:hypothetical protein